ncbi:uncharacterized protein DEA37_0011232, partial [Paragonimus westermani]
MSVPSAIFFLFFTSAVRHISAWDSKELQMFDLIDEMKVNFYDYLGVDKEEQLSTAYKRHKARDRKRQEIDAQISEELQKIPRPKWHDILPFALCKAVYFLIMFMPVFFGFVKEQVSNQIKEKYENVIGLGEEKAEKERLKLKKQERKKRILEQKQNVPSPYNAQILDTFLSLQDLPKEQLNETEEAEHETTKDSE